MALWKNILFWGISIIMMVAIVIYQRVTGPTYPIKGEVKTNTENIKFELPRSNGEEKNQVIKIKVIDTNFQGVIAYKRFPSNDPWIYVNMTRIDSFLTAELPLQPKGGKISYSIYLKYKNEQTYPLTNEPVIIRFRGSVPSLILILHIALIFVSITFSIRTGFEAIFNGKNIQILTLLTVITLLLGGMILGPIMQLYSFDKLWTGFPFGYDLTDNKTAVGMILWIIAFWRIRKNPNQKKWVIIASILLIIVFLIPHSVLGTEIDWTKVDHP